jgi:hypothetical protein
VQERRQKFQVETILADKVPDEYMLQIQTGLLVTGREWLDFVSYCAGLPMFIKRVFPDARNTRTQSSQRRLISSAACRKRSRNTRLGSIGSRS